MPPPERGDVLRRLVARAIDRPGYANLEPVVTKEIVHYDLPADVHAATFERADALGHVERTVRAQVKSGTRRLPT